MNEKKAWLFIISLTKWTEYLKQGHVFAIVEAAPVIVRVDEGTAFLWVSITWGKTEKDTMLYSQMMLARVTFAIWRTNKDPCVRSYAL